MKESSERHYASVADRSEGLHPRDIIERESRRERARHATRFTASDGLHPMTQGWAKYHPLEAPIPVQDAWGHKAWLTPTQHRVLVAARSLVADHSDLVSMSKVGASIGVATSTVSRALTRLAALGLVSYDTFKGRKGGIRLFTMSGKALKERSQRAWDRIKASKDQAAQRWRNKLEASGYDFASLNVATKRAMDATFSYLHVGEVPWTASDLADAGL